ncbi:maleylpyruvate isomerase N-terminal domain-containing protein [Iamia sp.]|uniref:maleylpyruvate isomerase N-terminal domain-containing protein n=1 Tax=Iamia sp. TaxID=2722710 RepID=UPI002C132BCF|nr:maleylpyruvate isomerase N-terminal domain-containing protein [Iamia sp.]HXH56147.1 maleylpyruvate isomerase N-terminal domain-containing protein [Iamia sp.]
MSNPDLEPAARRMAALIGGVSDEMLDRPTPCPDYRLGDLVEHVVVHHFATKAGLRQAVDDAVLTAFEAALAAVDTHGAPAEVSERLNQAVAGIIGGDRAVSDYLGRSLFEATGASQRLFDALTNLVTAGLDDLEEAGLVRPGTDRTWRAYTVLFIVLGPIVLSRQLEARLRTDAFAPDVVSARSAANIDILQHGLFTPDDPRPRM